MINKNNKKYFLYGYILGIIVMFILISIFSVPSIDEYCLNGKKAWLAIDIWKNEGCNRYWEEINKIENDYNATIIFTKQFDIYNGTYQNSCGLFVPATQIIYVRTNRTNCHSVNETISHELKHLLCYRAGQLGHNKTEAHSGCFLNITL